MGWSLRSVCVAAALVAAAVVASGAPAAAQFFNPFEALFGPPPRPPSAVPARPQGPPPGYPQYQDPRFDQRYPDQNFPNQASTPRQPPAAGVQSEPLAPPPGGATASVDPASPLPPGQRPPGAPRPDASPQPAEEATPEAPAAKVENKGAVFSGLDKITGRIINFDAGIGETVQFGALRVTPRACYTRPPTESPNTDAFIEVDEVTLQGEIKRIFTGWTFAASPGLHAVEHPIYDVWLTDCKNPVVAAAPPPAAAPAPPAPSPAKPPAQRRPAQQQPRALPQFVQPR